MRETESESKALWHVQHGFNAPQVMTRAELEAAYRRRDVSIRALVRKDGSPSWQTLGDVLEIDADDTLESISLIPVASEIDLTKAATSPEAPPIPDLGAVADERRAERSPRRRITALSLAVVLGVGGTVFVAVSTWLGGTGDAPPAMAAIALPPSSVASPLALSAAPILEEGSVLVLAKAPNETPSAATVVPAAKKGPPKKPTAKKAR